MTFLSLSPDSMTCLLASSVGRLSLYNMNMMPPMYVCQALTHCDIVSVDWSCGIVVSCSSKHDTASVHRIVNKAYEPVIEHVLTLTIGKGCSCVKFFRDRNEVYFGYNNGTVAVAALRVVTQSIISKQCVTTGAFKAHDDCVTSVDVTLHAACIVTTSKDKTIKVWRTPYNWLRDDLAHSVRQDFPVDNANLALPLDATSSIIATNNKQATTSSNLFSSAFEKINPWKK